MSPEARTVPSARPIPPSGSARLLMWPNRAIRSCDARRSHASSKVASRSSALEVVHSPICTRPAAAAVHVLTFQEGGAFAHRRRIHDACGDISIVRRRSATSTRSHHMSVPTLLCLLQITNPARRSCACSRHRAGVAPWHRPLDAHAVAADESVLRPLRRSRPAGRSRSLRAR